MFCRRWLRSAPRAAYRIRSRDVQPLVRPDEVKASPVAPRAVGRKPLRVRAGAFRPAALCPLLCAVPWAEVVLDAPGCDRLPETRPIPGGAVTVCDERLGMYGCFQGDEHSLGCTPLVPQRNSESTHGKPERLH